MSMNQKPVIISTLILLVAILTVNILIYLKFPQLAENSEAVDNKPNKGLLVGAYYYSWWRNSKWAEAPDYPNHPVLSKYNSRDREVIDQHVSLAKEYGIDFFAVSWWGLTPYWEDVTLRSHFLNSLQNSGIKFSIFYESYGRLSEDVNGIEPSLENEKILLSDFDYLATYFGNPQYLKINGRPVVILYGARSFQHWGQYQDEEGNRHQGWENIFGKLRANMAQKGYDIYLVGDMVYWQDENDILSNLLPFWLFDAITGYNMHTSDSQKVSRTSDSNIIDAKDFLLKVDRQYTRWREIADKEGSDFVPGVIPGFNDSFYPGRNNPIIPRSPQFFADFWQIALKQLDSDANMVMVASFNEWFEDTQVEPAQEYGLAYLEVIKTYASYEIKQGE